MRTALIMLLALPLLRQELPAQVPAHSIGPGARVRLWVLDAGVAKRTATVTAVVHDSLAVQLDDPPRRKFSGERATSTGLAVSIADVDRIEVMTGRQPNVLGGLKTGALVGGGLFLAMGLMSSTCDEIGCLEGSQIPAVTLGGVMLGGAIGLLVGALQTREVWQQVWLAPNAPPPPTTGGISVERHVPHDATGVRIGLRVPLPAP